jgi:hypothetical protein
MPNETTITWSKEAATPLTYVFQLSPKIKGRLKRKGIWSPEASAEMGDRQLRFRSNGKANMQMKIYEGAGDEKVGELNFYWKDFQNSELRLSNGKLFTFKSTDIFRGAWSWFKKDGSIEQVAYRVDNPFQRSGTLENNTNDLSALERDILLCLGLNLTHYSNTWLMTIAIVVLIIVAK